LQQTELLLGARQALFEFMYSGHDLHYPTRIGRDHGVSYLADSMIWISRLSRPLTISPSGTPLSAALWYSGFTDVPHSRELLFSSAVEQKSLEYGRCGSQKTSAASSKLTPCLLKLILALSGSHSNSYRNTAIAADHFSLKADWSPETAQCWIKRGQRGRIGLLFAERPQVSPPGRRP
jgi:hypothetical protein